MAPAEPDGLIDVELAFSPGPRQVERLALRLPVGSCVADALRLAGWLGRAEGGRVSLGVWGRRCTPDEPLVQGDRVELYRALQVDPKEARRLRYRRDREAVQGVRTGPARAPKG